ncbi:hypothetical protein PG991_000955 [Apiospora marii]|uniref:Glycoside hydrolase family 125 protein n=1 Tax=Apiospora marii TaxID=335849 RepID=A0ABR1SV82_9PEZI
MRGFSAQAVLAASLLGPSLPVPANAAWADYTARNRTPSSCPDYNDYSKSRHEPFSTGALALPNMRPSPECRTFNSSAVEKVISDMQARLKDPDMAMLFANTFPSTLDTTVKYFDPDLNLAFIITGVSILFYPRMRPLGTFSTWLTGISAQWLRDTGNQFAHLYRLLPQDKDLQALVKAVINTESRYIAEYPYCGAFQPPAESGLAPSHNDWADNVRINPPVNNQTVFECKYELDSLAGFLKISRSYYANTNDTSFMNDNWKSAMNAIMTTIHDQSQSTWTDDWQFVSYYNWTGTPGALSPQVPNGGNGEPKMATGLVASSHRPSDDLCVFNFITSDNAMMSVELDHIADMLDAAGAQAELSKQARGYAATIQDAVWNTTRTLGGKVFAYETNGYGGYYVMDDANVPSLASLSYLGFLGRDDPTYVATKAHLFSRLNPYYAEGEQFRGIGGPHVNATYPWPMSQVSAIYGSDDDAEIARSLDLLLKNTAGLGLIHESVSIYNASDYSRPWFAWANSYFAEMLLDLAERKPGLIFTEDTPYVVGQH